MLSHHNIGLMHSFQSKFSKQTNFVVKLFQYQLQLHFALKNFIEYNCFQKTNTITTNRLLVINVASLVYIANINCASQIPQYSFIGLPMLKLRCMKKLAEFVYGKGYIKYFDTRKVAQTICYRSSVTQLQSKRVLDLAQHQSSQSFPKYPQYTLFESSKYLIDLCMSRNQENNSQNLKF